MFQDRRLEGFRLSKQLLCCCTMGVKLLCDFHQPSLGEQSCHCCLLGALGGGGCPRVLDGVCAVLLAPSVSCGCTWDRSNVDCPSFFSVGMAVQVFSCSRSSSGLDSIVYTGFYIYTIIYILYIFYIYIFYSIYILYIVNILYIYSIYILF